MGNFGLDIPWTLIEPEDPSGSDMVDVSGVKRKWLDVPYAAQSLERGGRLYLEINQRFGNEMKRLLEDNGFDEVRIIEDSYGKTRFATGVRS